MKTVTQSNFHSRDWAYKSFVVRPEYGVPLSNFLEDAAWTNVANQLKIGNFIEILPEGLPYYAKLIVIDCGPAFAKVKVVEFVDLIDQKAPEQAEIVKAVDLGGFRAERNGKGFRVVRVSDGEVMKDNFRLMATAEKWARENLQVA